MTVRVALALYFAIIAHDGQYDKGGKPYVLHPLWVSHHMDTEDKKIVALFHDIVEDTKYTFEDIIEWGFGDLIEPLKCITKRKDNKEIYSDYIKRVSSNPISTEVKIVDMDHNSDLSRLKEVTDKDLERVEKYNFYKEILKETKSKKEESEKQKMKEYFWAHGSNEPCYKLIYYNNNPKKEINIYKEIIVDEKIQIKLGELSPSIEIICILTNDIIEYINNNKMSFNLIKQQIDLFPISTEYPALVGKEKDIIIPYLTNCEIKILPISNYPFYNKENIMELDIKLKKKIKKQLELLNNDHFLCLLKATETFKIYKEEK